MRKQRFEINRYLYWEKAGSFFLWPVAAVMLKRGEIERRWFVHVYLTVVFCRWHIGMVIFLRQKASTNER